MFGKVRTVVYMRISSKERQHETSINTQTEAAKKQADEAGITADEANLVRFVDANKLKSAPDSRSTLTQVNRGKRFTYK